MARGMWNSLSTNVMADFERLWLLLLLLLLLLLWAAVVDIPKVYIGHFYFPHNLKYSFTHSSIKPVKHLVWTSDQSSPWLRQSTLRTNFLLFFSTLISRLSAVSPVQQGSLWPLEKPRKSHAPYAAVLPLCHNMWQTQHRGESVGCGLQMWCWIAEQIHIFVFIREKGANRARVQPHSAMAGDHVDVDMFCVEWRCICELGFDVIGSRHRHFHFKEPLCSQKRKGIIL